MDPASMTATMKLLQSFAEYGGILGLLVGILLLQLIYMQFTTSKRLTEVTDKLLQVIEGNTKKFVKLDDKADVLVNAMDRRRCMAGEKLAEQVQTRERERLAAEQTRTQSGGAAA